MPLPKPDRFADYITAADDAALFSSPLPTTGVRRTTTRGELYSWYIYYVGNCGLGPFNFAVTAWHNLLHRAGWDPTLGHASRCSDGPCYLHAFGAERSTHSTMLITNAISFGMQAAVYLVLGSMADYGSWRPHIVTIATVVGWGVSFAWLGVTAPPRWRIGTSLYVLGMLSYRVALTFWMAAFPGLSRDTPEMHKNERGLADGRISRAEFERRDMLARNNLAHVSFFLCSIGELAVLAILCGIILSIARGDDDSNARALSIVCAYSGGVWSKPFHLSTTPSRCAAASSRPILIKTIQEEVADFQALTLNYLLMDGIAAQALGIGVFWVVQKRWFLQTKTMLLFGFFLLLITAWGCLGITQSYGFHNLWEFWVYQGTGGVAALKQAISQAMVSEVVPRGKEFMFFSLFAIVSQTSVVGLVVAKAIIDRTGNNNMPFTFLLGLGVIAMGILSTVDISKSRYECRKYLEEEAVNVYMMRHGEVREVADKLALEEKQRRQEAADQV
ncbi:uncharacterized protein COLE_03597 [Cutaneotrichosporon oleaginosum]|uniref:uncharacterized protein n=1 Tax=Cutaneotrichosporon oleaginosum TaxID=879819 RepID=UPI0013263D9E|nr:hypothetical protein COLE_03597 [Cutaneotrichosporon oleaginosum]